MDSMPQTTNTDEQPPAIDDQLRDLILRRTQVYRIAYLTTGVLAVFVYYFLPKLFEISQATTGHWLMAIAIPWFCFNVFVCFRWTDTPTQALEIVKASYPQYYGLIQFSMLGMPLQKPFWVRLAGIFWIVIAIIAVLYAFWLPTPSR